MKQYIPKAAVVAEIKRRIENLYPRGGQGLIVTKILKDHYEDFLLFLDTLQVIEVCVDFGDPKGDKSAKCIIDTKDLEVKDVDLEKEIENWIENNQDTAGFFNYVEFAKHFFELGLKAQNMED